MTLAELNIGDKFRVVKITVKGEIGKRLVDMGINNGVEGTYVRCALFGDPIHIAIRGYDITLRKTEASAIEVDRI